MSKDLLTEDRRKSIGAIFILIFFLIGMQYINIPALHLFKKVDLMIGTILFFLLFSVVSLSVMMRDLNLGLMKDSLPAIFLPLVALFYLGYGCMIAHNDLHRVFFEYQPFIFYFSFLFPVLFIRCKYEAYFLIKGIIVSTIIFIPFLFLQFHTASNGIIFLAGEEEKMWEIGDYIRFVPKAKDAVLILSFYLSWKTLRYGGILNLLFSMSFILSLILTFSRNLWVSYLIGLLVISWYERRAIFKKLPIIIGGGIVSLIVLFVILQNTGFWQRIVTRVEMISFTALETDNSLMWRAFETEMAMKAIKKSPFIGYGLGYMYHNCRSLNFESAPYYIHNTYLYLWVKMGIAGLIALGIFISGFIKTAWYVYRVYNEKIIRGIIISAVAFMIAMIFAAIVRPLFAYDTSAIILLSILYGIFLKLRFLHFKRESTPDTE